MEKTKKCPYCGEEILAVAKKCKHCGEWLEEKVKEQKACPICGEMVDIDLSQCPHCGEPTHFSETQDESVIKEQTFTNNNNDSDNTYLYCKNCNAELPIDAKSCSNCGDSDPFFIKKCRRLEDILGYIEMGLSWGTIYFASEYMGITLDITPKWLHIICLILIWFVLLCIFWIVIRFLVYDPIIKRYERIMHNNLCDHGHPDAIDLWKQMIP